MEMVEEGQNQPEIPPKRMKSQEIVEKGEADQISALPDCLLLEILSRLYSTKDAIRTGTLSKRWKHIWTLVPALYFSDYGYKWHLCDFVSLVDKTLIQCRQLKLKEFVVYTRYDAQSKAQVHNWIRYSINCNVEELDLTLLNMKFGDKFQLDQLFFINKCFTCLILKGCMLNPTGAISWKNLRILWISYGRLDEDLIENILSGSPLLETLVLNDCYGYRRLNITSKSIKNLLLYGYYVPFDAVEADIIEINAPNILSLRIIADLVLWKLLLVNVSSVVEAFLDYTKFGHYETTHKEAKEEMLKGFILNLRHVKKLEIGDRCTKVISRLEAKGFVFPSNIKFPDASYVSSDSDSDSVESEDEELFFLDDGPDGNEVD